MLSVSFSVFRLTIRKTCYQDGLHRNDANMSVDDFARIARQCSRRTYQFALGGCGDPDQHENFADILGICKEEGIVLNFTTSGLGIKAFSDLIRIVDSGEAVQL